MSAHYFAFQSVFVDGHRLCAECGLPYAVGQHIEIPPMKAYTNFVCSVGSGKGHSSLYTGDTSRNPELRRLRDPFCACGAPLVEEDTEKWQLTFEVGHPDGSWHPASVVRSKNATHAQRDGLDQLIEEGDLVRNVTLVHLDDPPVHSPSAPNEDDREALHAALVNVISNASNYPPKVQTAMLGQDTAPLRERAVDAVLGAGFRRVPAPSENVATDLTSPADVESSGPILDTSSEDVAKLIERLERKAGFFKRFAGDPGHNETEILLREAAAALRSRAAVPEETPCIDHEDRCCRTHATHVSPHRGCILR